MDADTARAVICDGVPLLETLPVYDPGLALALGTRLAAEGHDPALVAAVLTQARLRARAEVKFGEQAMRMLFTTDGLEQATRREVADRHAARFVAAGVRLVHDLGCGLGADALALARSGTAVQAVDSDEATAALAAYNLRDHPRAAVRHATAQEVTQDLTPHPQRGVWLDPARRTPGRTDASGRTRRTFRLEDMSPPWEFVLDIASRVPATGAKLSPGFPRDRVPDGAEAEWVSIDGELVECALWWGPLVVAPGRTATVLRDEVVLRVTEADLDGRRDATARGDQGHDTLVSPGVWLYEPDPAVIQAGLAGAVARQVDGLTLPGGYVVSRRGVDMPVARAFVVTEVLPARPKTVRTWLRRHDIGRVTIKKRGVSLDPEQFRRRIGFASRPAAAAREAILVLASVGENPTVLVVDRAGG